MTLAIVKTKETAGIPLLKRLVLKQIYDRDSDWYHPETGEKWTAQRCRQVMENAFQTWYEKFQLDKDTGNDKDPGNQFVRDVVAGFAKMLVDDEKGKYNTIKILHKEKGIDYRKKYGLQEAYTAAGLFKAQQAVEKYRRDNPDLENGYNLEDGKWN